MFKWAVAEELVKPDQLVALTALAPLRYGAVNAAESPAREAVAKDFVEATRINGSFRQFCGCWPDELCFSHRGIRWEATTSSISRYWVYPRLGKWWVDVRLEVKGQAVHISLDHDSESRFNCPKCEREYGCYDHAPGRTWRHLNTCQFQTLVHSSVPRVRCEEHGVIQVKVPWAEPHGCFTILMERFVIDVLLACQTVKGACQLLNISWDQAWHVIDRAVKRGTLAEGSDSFPAPGGG